MLEPPRLDTAALVADVSAAYHIPLMRAAFLPLGADPDTAVYRATTSDGMAYFLKLRRGTVLQSNLSVPFELAVSGLRQIIAPLPTGDGNLSCPYGEYTVILYRFVVGRSVWDIALSPDQWRVLGATLRQLHAMPIPAALLPALPHEHFDDRWRAQVLEALERPAAPQADAPAQAFAALLQTKRDTIVHMVNRARALAEQLRTTPNAPCLTHGDVHAGNLLLDSDGALYLVDWDTVALAAKERDLMFIGGGIGGIWNQPDEERWFYEGYGPSTTDLAALTYYRYERIVQDIAVYASQLLDTAEGGQDRHMSWRQIRNQFEPGEVVEIALHTDRRLQTDGA